MKINCKLDFTRSLGNVVYHVSCHQRVQFNGVKARELLSLVPGTDISVVERCSGHNGTYAVKAENHGHAVNIARPVVEKIKALPCQITMAAIVRWQDIIWRKFWATEARHAIRSLCCAWPMASSDDRKLTRADLFSLEEYALRRAEFRQRVMAHKQRRMIALGPHATLHYEDRLTMHYQVQEMLRSLPLGN